MKKIFLLFCSFALQSAQDIISLLNNPTLAENRVMELNARLGQLKQNLQGGSIQHYLQAAQIALQDPVAMSNYSMANSFFNDALNLCPKKCEPLKTVHHVDYENVGLTLLVNACHKAQAQGQTEKYAYAIVQLLQNHTVRKRDVAHQTAVNSLVCGKYGVYTCAAGCDAALCCVHPGIGCIAALMGAFWCREKYPTFEARLIDKMETHYGKEVAQEMKSIREFFTKNTPKAFLGNALRALSTNNSVQAQALLETIKRERLFVVQ